MRLARLALARAVIFASAIIFVSAMSTASAQAPPSQPPDPNAPVYVVGYIDVIQASKSQAMKLLKQFRQSCGKEDGNLRCEIAQRMEQQDQFVMLQIWKDQKSFQAHSSGPGAQWRDAIKPMLGSPYDQRLHTSLSVVPPAPAPNGRIIYVVTHVDVIPPRLGDTLPLLPSMAEAVRKETGNSRLEVLQQHGRPNHFTVIEIWGNKRQLDAHQAQARTLQYRETLQPYLGALYDERLYKILD